MPKFENWTPVEPEDDYDGQLKKRWENTETDTYIQVEHPEDESYYQIILVYDIDNYSTQFITASSNQKDAVDQARSFMESRPLAGVFDRQEVPDWKCVEYDPEQPAAVWQRSQYKNPNKVKLERTEEDAHGEHWTWWDISYQRRGSRSWERVDRYEDSGEDYGVREVFNRLRDKSRRRFTGFNRKTLPFGGD